MNLSDFKVLKEDGDSYTIGHPKGKSIMVSKKDLSPKSKEHIQKFASGGSVFDEAPGPAPTGSVAPLPPSGNDALISAPNLDDPSVQNKIVQGMQSAPPVANQSAGTAPMQVNPLGAYPTDTGYMNQAIKAIQGGAAAEAKVGQARADALQSVVDRMNTAPTPEDLWQKNQEKDATFMAAMKDIDPNHFWENKSTGSKILGAIGIALSGIGSGLTHGPNLAFQMIQDAVGRDIDAQKANQNKAMNLWKMNKDNYQEEQQAHLATTNQLLSVAQMKAEQAMAQAQGPLAQAKIAPLVMQIQQERAMNNFRMGQIQSTNSGGLSNTDPSLLVPIMVKHPDQQKQVFEEIGRAQNVSQNSKKMVDMFDQAANDNTVLRTGAGMVRTPGSVMALHQLMLPNFKQVDGTVRQAAMDETFHNITPSPGDTDAKIALKRQALQDWMHSETAAPVAKGNGIDLQRFRTTSSNPLARMNPQESMYYNWAKSNPQDPKAALVLEKLGVK